MLSKPKPWQAFGTNNYFWLMPFNAFLTQVVFAYFERTWIKPFGKPGRIYCFRKIVKCTSGPQTCNSMSGAPQVHTNHMGVPCWYVVPTWHTFLHLTHLLPFSHMNGSLFSSSLTPTPQVVASHRKRKGKQGKKRIYSWQKRKYEHLIVEKICHAGMYAT